MEVLGALLGIFRLLFSAVDQTETLPMAFWRGNFLARPRKEPPMARPPLDTPYQF